VQKALSIDFGEDLSIFTDGVYDDKTMAKVMEFQYKYQVADPMELRQISGMSVGPKTRNQLNKLFNK
jgi:peptidoglycan hydrolase-like protein with peptidoglycan-binding domain